MGSGEQKNSDRKRRKTVVSRRKAGRNREAGTSIPLKAAKGRGGGTLHKTKSRNHRHKRGVPRKQVE